MTMQHLFLIYFEQEKNFFRLRFTLKETEKKKLWKNLEQNKETSWFPGFIKISKCIHLSKIISCPPFICLF